MGRSKLIKSYRVGNVVAELKRKEMGNKGVLDSYYLYRLYVSAKSKETSKVGTYSRADIRDLMSLLIVLNANIVEITDNRE